MIYNEATNIRIDHLVYFDSLTKNQKEALQQEEASGKVMFQVPEKFKLNRDKVIYKIGFLMDFLKRLYPDRTSAELHKILNERYQVFVGERQLQRSYKSYLENKKYQ